MNEITSENIKNVIVEYVALNSISNVPEQLDDKANILDMIDSYSFIELIQHIEDSTGIGIDFAEADPEDLVYVGGLVAYVVGNAGKV